VREWGEREKKLKNKGVVKDVFYCAGEEEKHHLLRRSSGLAPSPFW
jgi:hypothetical protein